MNGHMSPGRVRAGVLSLLAVALAAGAFSASMAVAASPLHSTVPSSFSLPRCGSPCSLNRRLFDARLHHAETASVGPPRVATGAARGARPDVTGPGGFEGTVTDAKTKSPVTGIEVCAFELKALEEGAYEEEELEPACGEVVEPTGKYHVGVAPGEYVVGFFDPVGNYLTQFFNDHAPGESFNLVPVEAEKFTKNINAALSEGGRIEGTVTAASGGAPLEGFRVCALDEDVEEFKCVVTGSGGKYEIGGLRAGTYELGFFVPEHPGDNYFDATRAGVKVMLAAATTGVNAALSSGGEIEGTVTSAEGGAPLAHVVVCAFLASGEEEEECAETGADGSYAIERLPSGEYQVEFEELGAFHNQFYAGVPRLPQATAFAVTAGGPVVTGIDAAMFVHEGRITGHVTSEVGNTPLGGVGVCAIAPPNHVITCTHSEPDGEYTLEELPEGGYALEFKDPPDYRKEYSGGKATLAEAALVPVTFGGTTEANALLHLGGVHVEGAGSIEGRVTAQTTGLPLEGAIVCAIAATSKCEQTASDGTYTIADLPEGKYAVEFKGGPNFLIEFYNEASSLAESTPVDIVGETRATGIDAKLRPVVIAPKLVPTHVATGSSAPPPGAGGVLTTKIVVPFLTAASAVRVSGRRASVKLHCAVAPCHGTATLTITVSRRHRAHGHTVIRRITLVVGSGTFSLAQGASAAVTIHLTRQGKALLATAARHPRSGKLKLALQGAAATTRAVTVR